MKKKLLVLGFVSLITAGLVYLNGGISILGETSIVQAVGDLDVDWGVPPGHSLFNISNMLPGDSVSKSVTIHNGASSPTPITIHGTKKSETGGLSEVLAVVIANGGADLYGGTSPTGPKTLSQFLSESADFNGVHLADIPSDETIIITITVTFPHEAGNEYQYARVIFDLTIGIDITVPEQCRHIDFFGEPIFGTDHNDTLRGTRHNDLIFGYGGDDTIRAGWGDDCVVAGAGNDTVYGRRGDDVLFGNEGYDKIRGNQGTDQCEAEVEATCEE